MVHASPARNGGFSLLAVSVALALSLLVVSTVYTVAQPGPGGDRALRVRVELQLDATRAVRDMASLLEQSAPVDADEDYPYVWTDGASNLSAYAYLDASNPGLRSKDGAGPSREIAFRRFESDPGSSAIVVVPDPRGDELQVRTYDASGTMIGKRLLGRHVERLMIETSGAGLSQDQVRVTAWFRRVVDGKDYTACKTGVVTMRGDRN
jgi:hypothetical protein